MSQRLQSRTIFQSTLPARGATEQRRGNTSVLLISIHAPRTGSDLRGGRVMLVIPISIHAPRTGSDVAFLSVENLLLNFNPRSPHGERHGGGVLLVSLEIFQSTLPARGATGTQKTRTSREIFQSTLPARGATKGGEGRGKACKFQSTLPARGATVADALEAMSEGISIHAPRTGSDKT